MSIVGEILFKSKTSAAHLEKKFLHNILIVNIFLLSLSLKHALEPHAKQIRCSF